MTARRGSVCPECGFASAILGGRRTSHAPSCSRKLTPTQLRAKLVSALRGLGYETKELLREHGRLKAWMRPSRKFRSARSESLRVVRELRERGIDCRGSSRFYGDEYHVNGPRYMVTVNQDADTGNGGGAFVEVYAS